MGVTERKMNVLLERFRENKCIKKTDIMDSLQIKERSVKYYVQKLRDKGISVISTKGRYCIEGEIFLGNITDKEEQRLLSIVQEVASSTRRLRRSELVDRIYRRISAENTLSRKTIERSVLHAIQHGYLLVDDEGYVTLASDAATLFMTHEESVLRFLEKYDYLKGRIPFGDVMEGIVRKIEMTSELTRDDSSIIVVGRDYRVGQKLLDMVKKLEALDYHRKCIRLKYRTRNEVIEVDLEVVTLYFSILDNQAYLIGYPKNLDLADPYFYLTDSILALSANDTENTRFQDPRTMKKLQMMIGASMDGPYLVEVRFDDIYNIREKLERYKASRDSAELKTDSTKIILKDRIYGLADFARYLRGFGSYCEVMQPKELRERMIDSYRRMLKRYEVADEK